MTARSCSVEGCGKPARSRGWCQNHYARWYRNGNPLGGNAAPQGERVREIESSVRSNTDACILWGGATTNGYGVVRINGNARRAHRVVLELALGPPPSPDHVAAHNPVSCHNRRCVNPRHLRWATRAENEADRLLDGTDNRGERHGMAKLTRTDVLDIRSSGERSAGLSRVYGVSASTIRNIRRGESWSWLAEAQP